MWGCGGEFFSFIVKEKTWPTPLTPLVNSWPTPIWRYIRGDPSPLPSIYTFCSLDKIITSCGPVSYSTATSWCALCYCYRMILFVIRFAVTFTVITQNKVIVTVTLLTVLSNGDAWRTWRTTWSSVMVHCDSPDFVNFLSLLVKLMMINVLVQLWDYQSVKLPLFCKCFPVIGTYIF